MKRPGHRGSHKRRARACASCCGGRCTSAQPPRKALPPDTPVGIAPHMAGLRTDSEFAAFMAEHKQTVRAGVCFGVPWRGALVWTAQANQRCTNAVQVVVQFGSTW